MYTFSVSPLFRGWVGWRGEFGYFFSKILGDSRVWRNSRTCKGMKRSWLVPALFRKQWTWFMIRDPKGVPNRWCRKNPVPMTHQVPFRRQQLIRWPSYGVLLFTGKSTRKIPPKIKHVHLNKFFWTISVGFLTCVTGKKEKVRENCGLLWTPHLTAKLRPPPPAAQN